MRAEPGASPVGQDWHVGVGAASVPPGLKVPCLQAVHDGMPVPGLQTHCPWRAVKPLLQTEHTVADPVAHVLQLATLQAAGIVWQTTQAKIHQCLYEG